MVWLPDKPPRSAAFLAWLAEYGLVPFVVGLIFAPQMDAKLIEVAEALAAIALAAAGLLLGSQLRLALCEQDGLFSG